MSKEPKNDPTSAKSSQVELSNSGKIFTSLAAGGIAGGIAKTVIAPLDRYDIMISDSNDRNGKLNFMYLGPKYSSRPMRPGTTDSGTPSAGSDMDTVPRDSCPSGGETRQLSPELFPTPPSTLWHSSSTRNC